MLQEINNILAENERRNAQRNATFNPITGEGAILDREELVIEDFPISKQYVPKAMMRVPLIKRIAKAGSVKTFLLKAHKVKSMPKEQYLEEHEKVVAQIIKIRAKHDFCFWSAFFVYIKRKGGGEDVLFRLNYPQRKLISRFEERRLKGEPIRIILLKARQWGGSTATQIYMAWLQLMHRVGLNSLIVGHVKDASTEVRDMFDRMIKAYPSHMLHEEYNKDEPKLVGVGNSGNIHRIPQRNCKIKIGTAEKPDSARGGDYNLVHCTEVGLWKKTEGKTPEDIIRSACSGILLKPYTMIVYESTANGTGNFFHREYAAAKEGLSQFEALFIAWYEIEQYEAEIEDEHAFARHLYEQRNSTRTESDREECGKYLWWLWEKGATLQAIAWYIKERSKYNEHGKMAAEYPSDDVEAFVHSGAKVFDKYCVEALKGSCKPPIAIGEVYAKEDEGEGALQGLQFRKDTQGLLRIWEHPEADENEIVKNRYLTVVDIGGRSNKADFSVIVVFDRLFMMDGEKPVVVAQWYGHCDIDILAWKAVQIAAYYNNSLLVIESNTLETHDRERQVDGDQSHFILNQIKNVYDNLYARKQSEDEIINGMPRKYGFHTNVATKPMIISTLVKVIREGLYTERDEKCIYEYLDYEKKPNGAYGAITGKHDDLLMTRAIGLHICFNEMDLPSIVKKESLIVKKKPAVGAATI